MLSNTLKLNFCYLKIIHTFYPRYNPKIKSHILKNKQNSDTVNHNENEDENLKRSNRYDINRPRSRHGHKYSKYKI